MTLVEILEVETGTHPAMLDAHQARLLEQGRRDAKQRLAAAHKAFDRTAGLPYEDQVAPAKELVRAEAVAREWGVQ